MRLDFYGSQRVKRGISAGILTGYCLFFFCTFVYYSLKNEKRLIMERDYSYQKSEEARSTKSGKTDLNVKYDMVVTEEDEEGRGAV